MIFKEKDSLQEQIQSLELRIKEATPGAKRKRYEKDLACVSAGLKGEEEAAYHIDFHLKDSKSWAVIHDLRIELNDRVAQIDHLLISRLLEIYVIESKSFRTKIRYENGGWQRLNFNHWEGIPCPIEQNNRHIIVLKELIEQTGLAPTRLGLRLNPRFINVVVVHPSCSIGKMPREGRIYHMDQLVKIIRSKDPAAIDMLKVVSAETLHKFANELVAFHKPAPKPVTYEIRESAKLADAKPGIACQACGGPASDAEARFCRANVARFAGQILCRKCQAYALKREQKVERARKVEEVGLDVAGKCANCGAGVDKKVEAYCRFNGKKFGGRVLCRDCQVSI